MRRVLSAVALVALVSLSLSTRAQPARAGGTVWTFPSDCPTHIQACVDLASSGDFVFVFQNDAGASISISKSLTLASGDGTQYTTGFVAVGDAATPVDVTIQGLNVAPSISVFFDSAAGSSAAISDVTVTTTDGYASAISFDGEVSSSFSLGHSIVHGANGNALGLLAIPNGGAIDMHIVGNRFDGHGNAESGPGIRMATLSSGNVTADIYNNTIWDVARNPATIGAAIALQPTGTVHQDVNLVGNTIERSDAEGLEQRNDLASGGKLALDMFNNTFSHTKGRGVALTPGLAGTLTFRAGYNNYFANAGGNSFAGLSKGPNNLAVDPKFVNRTDGKLKLTPGSPLINKGQVCSPGGVADPDADGKHRLAGTSVDIGAFERDAVMPSGLVFVGSNGPDSQFGTDGADIMCGYGGNDHQFAGAGNDFVDGGGDNDFIVGSSGADRMLAGKGNDTVCADDGAATDFLDGGKGTDKFRADSGDTRKSFEQAAGTACDP